MTISTANNVTTDNFTTDTSASYVSNHTNGGSNGVWTFDTVNSRIIATGGNDCCLFNPSISLWNSYAEVDMDQSEGGGVQVMRYTSGGEASYNLYIQDSNSASNPNTFILYSLPSYNLLAQGVINFPRGTKHTIRLEVVRYDLVIYFDGVVIAIVGSSDVQVAGNCGMLGGNPGTQHYLRFAIGNFDTVVKPLPHYPVQGHCIYEYFVPSDPNTYRPRIDRFAAGGFKLIMQYYLIYDTTAHMIDYINYAASKGMKVIIALDRTFLWLAPAIQANIPIMYAESGNLATDATFTPYVVNQVKNLAGTWGYYVGDEVTIGNKAALQTHISVITGADSSKPTLQIQSDLADTSAVHRLLANWTNCASIIGDDVYPFPDTPHPSVEEVAYGTGKYCSFYGGIGQAIALQCYSKDGKSIPTFSMMMDWLASVYAYMQPQIILWFAYPDLLSSPNPIGLWSDLTNAIRLSQIGTLARFAPFMAHR